MVEKSDKSLGKGILFGRLNHFKESSLTFYGCGGELGSLRGL